MNKLLAIKHAPVANATIMISPAINTQEILVKISLDLALFNKAPINANTINTSKKDHMILNFPWVIKNCRIEAAKPVSQLIKKP